MSEESNVLLALKNAWTGDLAASEAVRAHAPEVLDLDPAAPIGGIDLDACHRVVVAQANAVMALQGLIERLQEMSKGSE